jgi:hypothetical protein
MNTATANSSIPYEPRDARLSLLQRSISIGIACALTVCLSVFTGGPDPKIGLLVGGACVLIGGRRLLSPAVWPLLAISAYVLFLSLFFPGSRPEGGIVFQFPLFAIDCMLLATLGLGGQSVRRQYGLLLGILVISFIGTVGDVTGHDMIAMLPFTLPDDDNFYKVTLLGDIGRARGFFPESGVLGAVSLGFATILGLGALVLIRFRASGGYAWLGLMGAAGLGGAIFCLTVTKSGLVMVAAGVLGFLMVLFFARNARCRGVAAVSFVAAMLAGAAFLTVPSTLSSYFRGEILAAFVPGQLGTTMASHSGMITRLQCWRIALTSIRLYPSGVGAYGLGPVLSEMGDAGFSGELRRMFSHDIFGLQNALANLISEGGVPAVGLLLYWLWVAFMRPIRHFLKDGSEAGAIVGAVYGASALACVAFLFSCELYPSFAFLLVLKFHADAIAKACTVEPASRVESIELIG